MKINERERAIVLIGLLLAVALFSLQTASAGAMGGGDSFDTATQIESGDYEDEIIAEGEKYYYIELQPGQELDFKITAENSYFYVIVFDDDRSKIKQKEVSSDRETVSFYYLASSKKDSYRYYIKIVGKKSDVEYHAKVAIEDHFDANSGTDAGDTFNDALSVSPGNYKGYLSDNDKSGNDLKDYYKLSIQSGDKVNIALTPSSEEARLIFSLFNEDRKTVKTEEPREAGAIARTMWLADSSQDIYILVKVEENSYYNYGGEYSLDITTGKAPLSERGTKSESQAQPGFEGFLALISLIVVYIGFRIRKGKNE